jgi:ribulose 1,5-bisphosphate synthetase/thiazole synthase
LEFASHTEFNVLRKLPEIAVETENLPLAAQTDVLVVGGGTSGAVAAYAAAGAGSPTLVVEMNYALGGTATLGGVSYYWFGKRSGFTRQVDRRIRGWERRFSYPREFYLWGKKDSWSPELRAFTLLEMVRSAGGQVFFNCLSMGALVAAGNRLAGAVLATPHGPQAVTGKVTVDATGDGDVAAFAGAKYIYGNERDRMSMWGALAWYRAPGIYTGGSFATTVDVGDILDWTRFILVGRRRCNQPLYDHAAYLAPRESRHIQGEVVLTLTDQLLMRTFPDTIALCFSNHDPKGRSTADLVYFGILPPHLEISIPYRALLPRGLDHLLVTGKALSCTHDALAAIRMIDDLQNQGGAAGLAAALCAQTDTSPRMLDVPSLQKLLVEIGSLPPNIMTSATASPPDSAAMVASLTGAEPFEWLEMSVKERALEPSPIILLCTAPKEEALPHLQAAWSQSMPGIRQLLLARLLLWHGDDRGLEVLLAEIDRLLEEDPPLPRRKASIRWCQLYPDHGVMAEVTYQVNLLARVDSSQAVPAVIHILEKLVQRIEQTRRDYTDMRLCLFNYIESIAYVAERLGWVELAPLLKRLLTLFELNGQLLTRGMDINPLEERLAYLVICLARALSRCGSRAGLRLLAEFTADTRISLARCARDELHALTGLDCGNQTLQWLAELRSWPEIYAPIPWKTKIN